MRVKIDETGYNGQSINGNGMVSLLPMTGYCEPNSIIEANLVNWGGSQPAYQYVSELAVVENIVKMDIIGNERYPVDGGSGGDHVSKFFVKVAERYKGNGIRPFVETKEYINSNERLSLLKVDDKTVATVIETRTEFNHVEFIFSVISQKIDE